MEWYKNDVKLKEDGLRITFETNGLVIRDVEESDEGEYLCQALNLMNGEMIGKNIMFEVSFITDGII